MNFVEITGGLGNQMFQYTFSKYLEKLTGQSSALYTNFYDYVKDDPVLSLRKFDLTRFNTHFISINGTVNYKNLIYEPSFNPESGDLFIDFYKGYWQDKKYYEENQRWILSHQKKYADNKYLTNKLKIYNFMINGFLYKIFRKIRHR